MLCYRLSVVIVLCCYLGCSVIIVLFYVLIVCTVTLPPGFNPIAVDKYIYIYYYPYKNFTRDYAKAFRLLKSSVTKVTWETLSYQISLLGTELQVFSLYDPAYDLD